MIRPLFISVAIFLASLSCNTFATQDYGLHVGSPTETALKCAELMVKFLRRHRELSEDPNWRQTDLNALLENLSRNNEFIRFTRERGISLASLDSKNAPAVLEEYFGKTLAKLTSAELMAEQRKAILTQVLDSHGIPKTAADPWERVLQVSRTNTAICRKQLNENGKKPNNRQVDELVQQIEIYFPHNSADLSWRKTTSGKTHPLVSSRIFSEMGMGGGLNSGSFNREIMGTDTFVYFKVKFRNRGSHAIDENEFGKQAILLKPSAAKNSGIISPFVMYYFQLENLGRRYSPHEFPEEGDSLETIALSRFTDEQLIRARRMLYQGHYAPTDFENVWREASTFYLNKLLTHDPESFAVFKEAISGKDAAGSVSALTALDRNSYIDALVGFAFRSIGQNNNWELKIPYAVLPSEIEDQ